MEVEQGDFLQCDETIKEFIRYLQQSKQVTAPGGGPFILRELGSVGLFVKLGVSSKIQEKIDSMLEKTTQYEMVGARPTKSKQRESIL
eukprot:m.114744 g.114744  ORF g.114744 m.114744 type:complete len:88 (+) comp28370_c2_seq1:53-316(+)